MNKKKFMGVGMVALGIAAFMVLVLPNYDRIKETRDTLATREGEVIQKEKFNEKMSQLKKQIEARQEDLVKVEDMLSSGKHTQDILVNLESISQEAGLALGNFKIGSAEDPSKNYQILQMEFGTDGQYATLLNLIKLLEKNLRIFDVQQISVAKKEAGEIGGAPLTMSLKVNTYYLK
ncbi:MAG: type 4a pilus biogenesis protein PilO [bacterium]|nr:type 4a pilus biogenesis protein PilO [bacterium]